MDMITPENKPNAFLSVADGHSERGTAIVIALFVLALIGVFVALALSRTASEASAVGNETSEARTLYAAQGGLETMTRNFNKVFEESLNPTATDLARVRDPDVVPGLSTALGGQYTFNQELDCVFGRSPDCRELATAEESTVVLSDGAFSGLYAIRDSWRLRSTATGPDGSQIELNRNILNNRIPIFQFGVFYDDDLELFNGPRFGFGGRVHTNRHFFLHPSANGAYFDSRVTSVGHIVTQIKRNGDPVNATAAQIWIKDAAGDLQQLRPNEGSVLNGTPNVFATSPFIDPELPPSAINPGWATVRERFDGNLQSEVKPLKLPLKVGTNTDLIEILRRPKQVDDGDGGDIANDEGTVQAVTGGPSGNADSAVLRSERFANKTGIRVSLADSKEKLPGCATATGAAVTTPCGVRLDGHMNGTGIGPDPLPVPITAAAESSSRGYEPKAMKRTSATGFDYLSTRVNGERLRDASDPRSGVWIKIETVETDEVTKLIVNKDITEDVLSLGMTEQAPIALGLSSPYNSTGRPDNSADLSTRNLNRTTAQPPSTVTPEDVGNDSRSVIKIQRFAIPGTSIAAHNPLLDPFGNPRPSVITHGSGWNYVQRYSGADAAKIAVGCPLPTPPTPPTSTECTALVNADAISGSGLERYGHLKLGGPTNTDAFVPFPIKMFDTREGLYFDIRNTSHYSNANFTNFSRVPRNGVMSMIDVDVANLRRFLRGDFDGLFPNGSTAALTTPFTTANSRGLLSSDIPSEAGWVLYVSDRRGDADFDGEFDMEDIYGAAPGNDGDIQPGEDLQAPGTYGHGILNAAYYSDGSSFPEAEKYAVNAQHTDLAAVNDHKYYRRGVRLINGTVLPGIYDSVTASNTKGFTLASENGVYVQGNYNATSASAPPPGGPTPYDQYFPFNQPTHIPASIVGDTVTVLSNSWRDSVSFISPYNQGSVAAAGVYPVKPGRVVTTTTHMRFAMISGDTITSRGIGGGSTPNQGGGDPRLNGGLHNFKRFLEKWDGAGIRLDYTGSLINLYNSRNNNGAFKCCNTVYNPPIRNWVFDSTFLDPGRLPPGTPFFQYVQTTGFQRSTD